MDVKDIVNRQSPPKPWAEGDNIPWHDPAFSERMLKEHLSQRHDLASRRFKTIDRHVEWIHRELLSERPSHILDLGCGPGLYLQRLAAFGHECVGIDYSPSSIAYAIDEATKRQRVIQYRQEDLRTADFGTAFDLVMLVYGELNVFTPADAGGILGKACGSLADGGILLLEVHTFDVIQQRGQQPPSWYSERSGLFSDAPHLCLQENAWDPSSRTTTTRYFVIDATTGEATSHAASYQSYTDDEYEALLADCGLASVVRHPSLTGLQNDKQEGLIVLVAKKQ